MARSASTLRSSVMPALLQTVDELAVRKVVHPRRRVDSGNPELTKIPLALPPVAIGIHERFIDRIGCGAKQFAAAAAKSFGQLQYFLTTSSRFESSFYSHNGSPERILRSGGDTAKRSLRSP